MSLLKEFWYVVCESNKIKTGKVLSAEIMGDWLAVYRDSAKNAVAVTDRCLHRNARLSRGKVVEGHLVCPYHGWKYGSQGTLVGIPSEGNSFQKKPLRCLNSYPVREKDGYIYVRLKAVPAPEYQNNEPISIPFIAQKNYQHIRLKHIFRASVPNCAENFIDIPHTTYVHPGIFRYESKPQRIEAEIEADQNSVHVRYLNETSNFGFFSFFLNRKKRTIFHEDHFYSPNVTHVEYKFGRRMHFNITSQSVPVTESETHVYTDLTFDYGIWNWVAKPFVWLVAKRIIAQDVRIMEEQSAVIKKYGPQFASTRADIQHVWIERIYEILASGGDLSKLHPKKSSVEFWI